MKPFTVTKESRYYFCTDTIVGWQYVFTSYPFFNIIIDSLKYCQSNKGLKLHGYVIMPNHIHTILSAESGNLNDVIRDFKRHTSMMISATLTETGNNRLIRYFSVTAKNDGKGNNFKVWQAGSHPIALYSEKFFSQKLNYIHENPVRKGYVGRPEHWIYSSARNYALGDNSIITIDILN